MLDLDSPCLCLIPTIRSDKVDGAVESAVLDGWDPIVIEDVDRQGPSATRERLFSRVRGEALVRYMDDDDTLPPHRERILAYMAANPNVDVVYTDYKMTSARDHQTMIDIQFSGDPYKDALRIHPWSWIARASALQKVRSRQGFLWDPKLPCREGGFTWLGILQTELTIVHIPMTGYLYQLPEGHTGIRDHREFGKYHNMLMEQLKIHHRT